MSRIAATFARTKAENRAALVTFLMGGDPTPARSEPFITALPAAGADIIEIGMPFSDPMADGPTIQAAGVRALAAHTKMDDVLSLTRTVRNQFPDTPIVLMGYYNPVFFRGVERFAKEAVAAGADGVILVDVPFEEEAEVAPAFRQHGLALIHLVAPTTSEARLAHSLQYADGFIYYVSVAGVTGTRTATAEDVGPAIARIRAATSLPIVAGFGISTPAQAKAFAGVADGVVVGSGLVKLIAEGAANGKNDHAIAEEISAVVSSLAASMGR